MLKNPSKHSRFGTLELPYGSVKIPGFSGSKFFWVYCLPVTPVFRAPTSSVNVGRWRWHAGLRCWIWWPMSAAPVCWRPTMVVETGSPCYRLCWSTGGTAAWQGMTIHIVSWDNVTDQLFERVGWVNSSWCCGVGVGGWPYWRVHWYRCGPWPLVAAAGAGWLVWILQYD